MSSCCKFILFNFLMCLQIKAQSFLRLFDILHNSGCHSYILRHSGCHGNTLRHSGCHGYILRHNGRHGNTLRHNGCHGYILHQHFSDFEPPLFSVNLPCFYNTLYNLLFVSYTSHFSGRRKCILIGYNALHRQRCGFIYKISDWGQKPRSLKLIKIN